MERNPDFTVREGLPTLEPLDQSLVEPIALGLAAASSVQTIINKQLADRGLGINDTLGVVFNPDSGEITIYPKSGKPFVI